jgi:hypothetical protein
VAAILVRHRDRRAVEVEVGSAERRERDRRSIVAKKGGDMTTRRAMLLAALVSLSTAFSPAPAGKSDLLEVTYYYLPG